MPTTTEQYAALLKGLYPDDEEWGKFTDVLEQLLRNPVSTPDDEEEEPSWALAS